MIRFVVFAVLLLHHGSAFAGWVALEKSYQTEAKQSVYADPDTVRRDGGWVTLWQLIDIKWMGEPPTPRFLSAKTHKQFDCARRRFRVLEVVQYSRQMATGKSSSGYIENGNWQPIEPQSVNYGLLEIACRKP